MDVVSPSGCAALAELAVRSRVHWYVREFTPADARGCRVVVLTEPDRERAIALRSLGRRLGFWLCAIDQPDFCDWVNVGVVRAGPIQIAIGSGGGAPGLVRALREGLSAGLSGRFARFAERLADRRERAPRELRRQDMRDALAGLRVRVEIDYPAWEAEDGG